DAVSVASDNSPPVGAETQSMDLAFVPLNGLDRAGRLGIPDHERVAGVNAGGGNPPAVGAKSQRENDSELTVELLDRLAGFRVPDGDDTGGLRDRQLRGKRP